MIIINFMITFFRLIVEKVIELFLENSLNMLLFKCLCSILMTIILYYLYYYYKKDYKFSKIYALNTIYQIITSLVIITLYYGIFVLGFLFIIRFYNSNKVLNLDIKLKLLWNILKTTTYSNIIITVYLIVVLIILLKYVYYLFLQYIRFHKNRLYYFTFLKEDSFENIFWFIVQNLTINKLLKLLITQNIAYILYFLGFIYIDHKKYTLSSMLPFSYKVYDNLPPFALIFTTFIHSKAFFLHYYVLFLVFFYDVFYNYYTLEYVYKIMPYVFIYEVIVRMSKSILVKNRDFDEFLSYYLYATCFEKNENIITLGDKTWTQEEAYDIVVEYAFNDFKDKNKVKQFLIPFKYDPFTFYNTSYFDVSEKIYINMKKNFIFIIIFFIFLIFYA